MEVTALCKQLLLNTLLLLAARVQTGRGADFRIVPSRLQLFDHESVSFSCQGLNVSAGWRVRNIKNRTSCLKSTVTCTNKYALVSDSGEYWCEGAGGEISNTVTITVTGGSVILESPVLPVMEGESVSLRCRTKKNVSDLTANFYKDGLLIGSSSTGNITIESVSRSDDGLYKCNISGAGESPQSRLMVTVRNPGNNDLVKQGEDTPDTDSTALHKETSPSTDHSVYIFLPFRTVFITVSLVLQLLVVALFHFGKLGSFLHKPSLNLTFHPN